MLQLTKQGASVIRFLPKNPLSVLAEIADGDRSADKKRLYRTWRGKVSDDPDLLEAVLLYAFENMLASWQKHDREAKPKKRTAMTAARRQEFIQKASSTAAAIIIGNWKMPNGKPLLKCTGAELATFFGFGSRIARKVKPHQIAGDVLSEADLKKLYVEAARANLR